MGNFKRQKIKIDGTNGTGTYTCRERVQGHYPALITRKSLLAQKITYHAHNKAMHGVLILTMVVVREN